METCSCGDMLVCVTVLQFGDSLGVMCLQSSNTQEMHDGLL